LRKTNLKIQRERKHLQFFYPRHWADVDDFYRSGAAAGMGIDRAIVSLERSVSQSV
jgi:hypothetical protein